MSARQCFALLTMIGAVLCLPLLGMSAYQLKSDFGSDGIATNGFGNYDDKAYDIALQADGKIVVVGTTESEANTDGAIARYTATGSLDFTFSTDGRETISFGNGDDYLYGLTLLDDGSIIVAGSTSSTDSDATSIALARLTENGILDVTFGVGGQVTYAFTSGSSEAKDVLVDVDGNILVAGTRITETATQGVVLRFDSEGNPDDTFGDAGVATLAVADHKISLASMALQSDGKIVVSGAQEDGDEKVQMVLFRLGTDGQPDTTYGTDGKTVVGTAGNGEILGLAMLTDDAAVATGYSTNDEQKDMTTVKLTKDGLLDNGFGNAGLTISDLGGASVGYSIGTRVDGTILVAGEVAGESSNDVVLVHFDAKGVQVKAVILTTLDEVKQNASEAELAALQENAPDTTLVAREGDAGPVITDINGYDDQARAIAITSDGVVLAAGTSNDGTTDDFALLAYEDATTSPNPGGSSNNPDNPYLIYTMSVHNVTRNSAMSGGVISKNLLYDCDPEVDNDCITVEMRGVVYGVEPYPSYEETSTSSSENTSSTSTNTSTTTENNSVFPDWTTDTSYNYELVRSGQTSDGSGFGVYGSDITKITPDQRYYIRAYAVLSDDTVIYGNQLSFVTDDACFIATAAYGSILNKHVQVLRQFRDSYLKTNSIGRKIVATYYTWSPGIAEKISQSTFLRKITQILLLPFIALSYAMVYSTAAMKIMFVVLVSLTVAIVKIRHLRNRQEI